MNKKNIDLSIICDGHWDVVFDHLGLGFWELSIATGILRSTRSFKQNFGYPPDGVLSYETVLGLILAEDLDHVQDEVELTITKEKNSYDVVYRIRRPDGKIRWIKANGILSQQDGETLKLIGTTLDVTDLKQS
ncbi:PAS domain-containing protein [Pedobacter sp. MR2016-19]|uniref:PAS domain-containing protein n=1 Tax=Pedobacter sp. MR2016-19 TaxID=2780089 RepID=UPI0018738AE2|nr:PAS domain-containing protein [Pedobacter sp. MR2016-19]MBE5318963.1 PAS domain-containing protein [Pedobacter sp. MR2016-19]